MIIYKVTNKTNGKVYIGQTVLSLEQRRESHYKEALFKKGDTTYFHNALRKYRRKDFIWEVLEDNINDISELNEKEIYYISKFNTTDKAIGYNLKAGGNGGGLNSESTKQKIGLTTKAKWNNPEIAQKMKEGLLKGNETQKSKAQNNYKSTFCKECGKEIIYRPMDVNSIKPSFCCKECFHKYLLNNKGLQKAKEVNLVNKKLKNERLKKLILDWIVTRGDLFLHIKYNRLTDIFKELKNLTNLKDERSIMKIFHFISRKDFVTYLSKIYAELTRNCKN